MNSEHSIAPSLEAWLNRARLSAADLPHHLRSFPTGKCLSGHILDRLKRVPGLIGLENAWGGGLGSAPNKQKVWKAMLSKEGIAPSDSESGYLLRYSSDPATIELPHPYLPPVFCLSDKECFLRYICQSETDWHIALSWSEQNRIALTTLLRHAIADDHYHSASRYMNLGGRYAAELAVALPAGDNGLIVKSQWVAQELLFKAVAEQFPDAISEYAPTWLGSQRIDIYIPSRRVAIEYQGEQHYRPISRFGGAAGLKATKERDRRKASLCSENGVTLIYWRYDDEMSSERIVSRVARARKLT